MRHKGTSVYISYCQLQQVTQPHRLCYIAIRNIQLLYINIYQCLSHVTQINICIHFVLPAIAGHIATLHYATYLSATYSSYIYIYISFCVLWHKATSVYISYCPLQQVTKPHCIMLHSYEQHTAAIYIYRCLCHVTQRNISIHFVLPATAGHNATLQYAT